MVLQAGWNATDGSLLALNTMLVDDMHAISYLINIRSGRTTHFLVSNSDISLGEEVNTFIVNVRFPLCLRLQRNEFLVCILHVYNKKKHRDKDNR